MAQTYELRRINYLVDCVLCTSSRYGIVYLGLYNILLFLWSLFYILDPCFLICLDF